LATARRWRWGALGRFAELGYAAVPSPYRLQNLRHAGDQRQPLPIGVECLRSSAGASRKKICDLCADLGVDDGSWQRSHKQIGLISKPLARARARG